MRLMVISVLIIQIGGQHMRSWDDAIISVKDVNYEDAVEAIRRSARKYKTKHIAVWDDLVWRCWEETGLDHRGGAELEQQPKEVRAYYMNKQMLQQTGLVGSDDAVHILFICRQAQWAVVASTGVLVEDYEQ
jgi:hypothetical protein